MNWITKSSIIDLTFIILPGLICLSLSKLFHGNLFILGIILSIVVIVDTSHIYSTFWRTIFVNKEFNRSKFLYIYTPLAFLAIFLILFIYFEINFFWSILFYASIYHQIRQNIGISKWYSKINNIKLSQMNLNFLYLLTFFPVVLFHLRPYNEIKNIYFYSPTDILFFSNEFLFNSFKIIYLVLVFIYIIHELYIFIKNKGMSRILFNFSLILLHYLCFVEGNTLYEVLLPPLFLHGLSYLIINYISYKRTNKTLFFKILDKPFLVILLPIIIGSIFFIIDEKIPEPEGIINSIVFSIYIIPIACHHFWDAFIWKKSHPDSDKIYNK